MRSARSIANMPWWLRMRVENTRRITRQERSFSFFTILLFIVLAAHTAFPLIDVPLFGLSLSAPIFFFIVLEVFFRPPEPWLRHYRRWISLAAAIWFGIFASIIGNSLFRVDFLVEADDIVNLVRYTYWLLIFIVTVYFVSRSAVGTRLANILMIAITATALLRWIEALLFGKIGAWTNVTFMSQNGYGILFSTYSPLILVSLVSEQGRRRLFALLNALIVWGAVAINGSRGSWISVTVGVLLFTLLLVRAYPARFKSLVWIALLFSAFLGVLLFAPYQLVSAVDERFATFQQLDEDKSFAIRQLMIQKGQRLFLESPIFGAGIGRFKETSVSLDIPPVLSYAPQSHFDVKSAHNSYIAFLAETGLAGSLWYGLLLLILSIGGYRSAVSLARRGELWAVGFYVSFVAMSLHLWALSGLTNTGTWFIYGLVASVIVVGRQRNSIAHDSSDTVAFQTSATGKSRKPAPQPGSFSPFSVTK